MPNRATLVRLLPASLIALVLPVSLAAHAQQTRDAVCQNGVGEFSAKSSTGVIVHVGSLKVQGFASHDCESTLSWKDQQLIVVPHAWQLDVDAMDIDLGLGAPVLALQVKPSAVDRIATYQIYSLGKPPQLLKEITGGDVYTAEDTDLDGHIEIWTHDAKAVDGFDDIPFKAYDFPPSVALRFEKHRLLDVSAEFTAEFDKQISEAKAQLSPEQLAAFKATDGTLAREVTTSPLEMHNLIRTKIGVLEIVFAYLYSGREDQAWQSLRDLWPAADYDRIHAAMLAARAGGILKQIDGARADNLRSRHHISIFDTNTQSNNHDSTVSASRTSAAVSVSSLMIADSPPVAIDMYMKRAGNDGEGPLEERTEVHMVIDDAGKVHSIQFLGPTNLRIMAATAGWRFIPAHNQGHPVACSLDMFLSSPK